MYPPLEEGMKIHNYFEKGIRDPALESAQNGQPREFP